MRVIAWDIGLKNLSYCILEDNNSGTITRHDFSVIDWDLINLYPEEICDEIVKDKACGKKATYYLGEKHFCKKHSAKKKKIKNKNPCEYAMRIKKVLDEKDFSCDIVLLENQPVHMNPIMKTVQIILLSYFSFKGIEVKNVNAKRKEKLPEKDEKWEGSEYHKRYMERIEKVKNKYSRRKFLCLEYAKMCLETAPELQEYLSTHKKQDDLTDSFLMCTDYLL
jgi:hypothetical protein